MPEDLEIQDQLRDVFLDEAAQLLDDFERILLSLSKGHQKNEDMAAIFRAAHSLKGSGASVGFTDLAAFAHINEDLLSVLRGDPSKLSSDILSLLLSSLDIMRRWVAGLRMEGIDFKPPDAVTDMKLLLKAAIERIQGKVEPSQKSGTMPAVPSISTPTPVVTDIMKAGVVEKAIPAAKVQATTKGVVKKDQSHSIKIDSERLDAVMDLVGELVVIKSQILEDQSLQSLEATRLNALLALLDKNVRDLYDRALSLRMTTVKGLMLKLERAVRDAAMKVNKEVDFVVNGDDCEMDRLLIEKLGDPLMHLVRNAVDHGLESRDLRKKAGKPTNGRLTINVANRGSGIVFDIMDDGRGIDREKIISKAIEKNLISDPSSAQLMQDTEVFGLLFASGFSTAEKVTDLSGRGVGLDVVKSNVNSLKGSIDVSSTVGIGSTFSIRLPLTTAIADGLIVRVAEERYILPLDAIDEVLSIGDVSLTPVSGQDPCVEVHGRFLPFVDLLKEFDLAGGRGALVVVLKFGSKKFAIIVDEIIGQSQVVIKNLHDALVMSKGVAGTAILGDGKVALVLDVPALVPG